MPGKACLPCYPLAAALVAAALSFSPGPAPAQPAAEGPSSASVSRGAFSEIARWTRHYERRHAIPAKLLWAMSIAETGRKGAPWAWTLNVNGTPVYFSDRAEAERALAGHREDDVDVGPMQVNLRWHGHRFSAPVEALEPRRNIAAGAAYLFQLRASHGSWTEAVGRYHGGKAERRRRYICRVYALMVDLHGRERAEAASSWCPRG